MSSIWRFVSANSVLNSRSIDLARFSSRFWVLSRYASDKAATIVCESSRLAVAKLIRNSAVLGIGERTRSSSNSSTASSMRGPSSSTYWLVNQFDRCTARERTAALSTSRSISRDNSVLARRSISSSSSSLAAPISVASWRPERISNKASDRYSGEKIDRATNETPPTPIPTKPEKITRSRCFRRIRIGSTETPASAGVEEVRISSDFDSDGSILILYRPKRGMGSHYGVRFDSTSLTRASKSLPCASSRALAAESVSRAWSVLPDRAKASAWRA